MEAIRRDLEMLWVLAWAPGDRELPWPAGCCDVLRLTATSRGRTGQPDFVAQATLRPKAEVLDALQLPLLQHWAVRDDKRMSVRSCPATGVVAERPRALNRLVRHGDAARNDVKLPTRKTRDRRRPT